MKAPTHLPIRPSALQRALFGAVCGGLALSLTACGGGGSSSPSASSSSGSVSGVVLDGPIQGATVCLDLNANQQCDSGEPASAPTDAQGNYTITGLTTDQQNAGKEWIAVVPVGATDGGTPFTQPFVLRAPANKPGVISPFTHMVQVAIDQGASSQSAAETLVATQLGLDDPGSIYSNYSSSTPTVDSGVLAATAPIVVDVLQGGQQPTLVTKGGAASAEPYSVRLLQYTDAANYTIRLFYRGADDPSGLGHTFYDVRGGLTAGAAMTNDALYGTNLYLTKTGWVSAGPTLANSTQNGNPSTSQSRGYRNAVIFTETDLSGQAIAEAVNRANDLNSNTEQTLAGVNATTLSGTLPAGATVKRTQGTTFYAPVVYTPTAANSVTQSYPGQNITTIDALISAFPVSSTPSGATTVGMGDLHLPHSCPAGQTSCVLPAERLRVMFGPNNVAQYALCDLNWPTNTSSNCQLKNAGTYTRGVGLDGITPIVQFSGLPAEADVKTSTRVFVEATGQVWYGYQEKLTSWTYTRLNDIAFAPIAQQLGITVPANPN